MVDVKPRDDLTVSWSTIAFTQLDVLADASGRGSCAGHTSSSARCPRPDPGLAASRPYSAETPTVHEWRHNE
jgi:hypothetical protein